MTKYILFKCLALVMFISQAAYGQFNQGRWLAGGSVAFNSSNSETTVGSITAESSSTSFGFGPDVGYFVIDNLVVGAAISLSTSKSDTESGSVDVESKNTSISFGPFVRYYLPVAVFFQASTAFGSNTFKAIEPVESETKTGIFRWGLGAGYAFFLNDFVALEPMIGYQSTAYNNKDNENKTTNGDLYLSAAFTIYLGERK